LHWDPYDYIPANEDGGSFITTGISRFDGSHNNNQDFDHLSDFTSGSIINEDYDNYIIDILKPLWGAHVSNKDFKGECGLENYASKVKKLTEKVMHLEDSTSGKIDILNDKIKLLNNINTYREYLNMELTTLKNIYSSLTNPVNVNINECAKKIASLEEGINKLINELSMLFVKIDNIDI